MVDEGTSQHGWFRGTSMYGNPPYLHHSSLYCISFCWDQVAVLPGRCPHPLERLPRYPGPSEAAPGTGRSRWWRGICAWGLWKMMKIYGHEVWVLNLLFKKSWIYEGCMDCDMGVMVWILGIPVGTKWKLRSASIDSPSQQVLCLSWFKPQKTALGGYGRNFPIATLRLATRVYLPSCKWCSGFTTSGTFLLHWSAQLATNMSAFVEEPMDIRWYEFETLTSASTLGQTRHLWAAGVSPSKEIQQHQTADFRCYPLLSKRKCPLLSVIHSTLSIPTSLPCYGGPLKWGYPKIIHLNGMNILNGQKCLRP